MLHLGLGRHELNELIKVYHTIPLVIGDLYHLLGLMICKHRPLVND